MHKRTIALTVAAFLLIVCFLCLSFVPVKITTAPIAPVITEQRVAVRNAPLKTEQPEPENAQPLQIPCEERFVSMLNLNTCFNISADDVESLVHSSTVSLSAYSYDAEGYGICVNANLVAGFIKSFYGINVDAESIESTDAPYGYIRVPECGFAEFTHSFVSMCETADGYEVVTVMESYYGGNDIERQTVKSFFVSNTNSEFGFNLVSCEIV